MSKDEKGTVESAGRERGTTVAERIIALDLDLCKACGICIGLCPAQVFDADSRGFPVAARPADCTRCLLCEFHCPDFAIEVARPAPKRKRRGAAPPADDVTQAEGDGVYAALSRPRDEDGRTVDCGHDEEP